MKYVDAYLICVATITKVSVKSSLKRNQGGAYFQKWDEHVEQYSICSITGTATKREMKREKKNDFSDSSNAFFPCN